MLMLWQRSLCASIQLWHQQLFNWQLLMLLQPSMWLMHAVLLPKQRLLGLLLHIDVISNTGAVSGARPPAQQSAQAIAHFVEKQQSQA